MLIILIFKMASSVLKRKCKGEGSNHVSWKTGGKPVQVTLGPLPKQQQQVTHEDIRIIQATAGLSQEQTLGVASGFQMARDKRRLIQPYLSEAIHERNQSIDGFFTKELHDGVPLVRGIYHQGYFYKITKVAFLELV